MTLAHNPRKPAGPRSRAVMAPYTNITLRLPEALALRLDMEAHKRNMTVKDLLNALLAHIVEDDLITAVLDDA